VKLESRAVRYLTSAILFWASTGAWQPQNLGILCQIGASSIEFVNDISHKCCILRNVLKSPFSMRNTKKSFSLHLALGFTLLLFANSISFAQSKEETIEFILEADDGDAGYLAAKLVFSELKMLHKSGHYEIADLLKASFAVRYDGFLWYYVYDTNYSSAIWAAASNSPTWMLSSRSKAESLVNALNHLKKFAKPSSF
jgi:hypothetical protein